MADAAQRATRALALGFAAVPLWALSYIWMPFRHFVGSDPGWVWPAVIVGEIGAVVTAITALVAGLRVRKSAPADPTARRRAGIAALLGVIVLALVVGLNVLWTFFVSI